MSIEKTLVNRVKDHRLARGWTQAELAERASISRTAVSAIEGNRLVPSVAAALALAQVLKCTVEDLFGASNSQAAPAWAWDATPAQNRYWLAEVQGKRLAFPVEETPCGEIEYDGLVSAGLPLAATDARSDTLVLAGCDPAVSLLATLLARESRVRLIPLLRSSRAGLKLLGQGLVHIAGIHLSETSESGGNAEVVRRELGTGYRLLRIAEWEEGVTLASGTRAASIRSVVRAQLRWVGRDSGSGAQQCLDELFSHRRTFRHIAYDHRGVASAIRSGWADAGICLRLVSNEAGQEFLPIRWESYDLCYPARLEGDPRIRALVDTVRSTPFRQLLAGLPGYDPSRTGDLAAVE